MNFPKTILMSTFLHFIGHLLQKSLSREFLSQQRNRPPWRAPSSLSCCAHTEQRKCEFLFFSGVNSHLKHFQEEVNVKPPHAEALPDDSKQEGDADDEEDGGEEDVDRGEDEQLQKHSHL